MCACVKQAEEIQPPHIFTKNGTFFFTLDDWTKCQQRTTQVYVQMVSLKNSGVVKQTVGTANIKAHGG